MNWLRGRIWSDGRNLSTKLKYRLIALPVAHQSGFHSPFSRRLSLLVDAISSAYTLSQIRRNHLLSRDCHSSPRGPGCCAHFWGIGEYIMYLNYHSMYQSCELTFHPFSVRLQELGRNNTWIDLLMYTSPQVKKSFGVIRVRLPSFESQLSAKKGSFCSRVVAGRLCPASCNPLSSLRLRLFPMCRAFLPLDRWENKFPSVHMTRLINCYRCVKKTYYCSAEEDVSSTGKLRS